MQHTVDIDVSFYYGGWSLSFNKVFILPFAPFYDLEIDDKANTIELQNNDYCKTVISFNVNSNEFNIDNRNIWRNPLTEDTVDTIIEQFSDTGWERTDKTDEQYLKELMLRDYKNQKDRKFNL